MSDEIEVAEVRHSSDLARELGVLTTNMSIESGLLAVSGIVKNQKLRTVLVSSSVGITVGKKVWSKIQDRRRKDEYHIRISESDQLYSVLQNWFMEALPESEQYSVIAESERVRDDDDMFADLDDRPSSRPTRTVSIFFDGTRRQEVQIDGHLVEIFVQSDSQAAARGYDAKNYSESGSGGKFVTKYITIECPTLEARNAVIKRLRVEASLMKERRPAFYTSEPWGGFNSNSDIPLRSLDSVILKAGQADRIREDIKEFLGQEKEYAALGLPYHRGILLHGLPGTGKTSTASAIASDLGLDVYYVALSSVKNDDALVGMLRQVSPRSVLLLEDIDIAHAVREREDGKQGVTMSGLLNALDGLTTPHGVIIIMTTNHIDVLDDAIKRPGRVDLLEEVSAVDSEQLERLCEQFIGHVPANLPHVEVSDEVTASEIVDVFKRNLRNKQQAGVDLVELLNEKVNTHI